MALLPELKNKCRTEGKKLGQQWKEMLQSFTSDKPNFEKRFDLFQTVRAFQDYLRQKYVNKRDNVDADTKKLFDISIKAIGELYPVIVKVVDNIYRTVDRHGGDYTKLLAESVKILDSEAKGLRKNSPELSEWLLAASEELFK